MRKVMKCQMERRRREKINTSLEELRTLVIRGMNMDPTQYAKLEKTDILELAVIYLKRNAPRPNPNDSRRVAQQREGFMACMNAVLENMRRVCELEEGAATVSGRESPAQRLTRVIHERLANFLNTQLAPENEEKAPPPVVPVLSVTEDSQDAQPHSPLSPTNSLSQQYELSCMSCPAAIPLQRPAATHTPSDVDTENSQTLLLPPLRVHTRDLQRPLSSDSNNNADSSCSQSSSTRLTTASCTCPSRAFTAPQVVQLATLLPVPAVPLGSKRSFASSQRSVGSSHWRAQLSWPPQVVRDRENRPPPAKTARSSSSDGKFNPFWRPWEC